MTLVQCPASGLRPPFRLCLNCCGTPGSIKTAQLEFLGYTVSNQAFSERSVFYTRRANLICFPYSRGLVVIEST
jgi:hypothetical protein